MKSIIKGKGFDIVKEKKLKLSEDQVQSVTAIVVPSGAFFAHVSSTSFEDLRVCMRECAMCSPVQRTIMVFFLHRRLTAILDKHAYPFVLRHRHHVKQCLTDDMGCWRRRRPSTRSMTESLSSTALFRS